MQRFGSARLGCLAASLAGSMAAVAPARAETLFGPGLLRGTQSGATFEVPDTSSVSSPSCFGRAGLYGGERGFKMWVLRQGTMSERNPLRPLSRDNLLVLEVVANGRLATAYGPDAANLAGAGAVPDLERANSPIRWAPSADQLPQTIRVVSSDGSVLIGPLPFRECGDAPKAAPARTARPAQASGGGGSGGRAAPPVAMPQGAIPER